MKILLTGASGYVGKRLLQSLLLEGHEVVALVRSPLRFSIPKEHQERLTVLEGDLLKLKELPKEIDAAYYLVHSMAQKGKDFAQLEATAAQNFIRAIAETNCRQILYLSGLVSDENLSPHLESRLKVEHILASSSIPLTTFRAGIIIGSGSASFEIIRDLVEKLPVMIAPLWVSNRCQPISIRDVLFYLTAALGNTKCYGKSFDIGGPEVLTYKEMLYGLAEVRGLTRRILSVPVLTPRLSSYWLYFVTSTNYYLAQILVDSLRCDAVCHEFSIDDILPHHCLNYKESVELAFQKIEQNEVISSWKDSMAGSALNPNLSEYFQIPKHGCLTDKQIVPLSGTREETLNRLWSIGGNTGWYYMNWAWEIRGFIDKLYGGVGLRRGRTHPTALQRGDALDFWRVLYADKEEGRLLLYAEMKVPGEAWLEFKIEGDKLIQTASFRPSGLLGRLYWYALLPFHRLIFKGMAKAIG